jgi:flagellar motor switch protein FliM
MESQRDVPELDHGRTAPAAFRPERLLDEQLDLARTAFQQFLDNVAPALPAYLASDVGISFAGASQRSLSAAMSDLEAGACVAPMDLSPFVGMAYLVLGRHLAGGVLENLMGAPMGTPEIPRNSLTTVDLQVLQDFLACLLGEVRAVWEPVCGCSFQPLPPTVPEASAVGDSVSVLVLDATVTLDGVSSALQLMIPSHLVRSAHLGQRPATDSAASGREAFVEAVCSASFDVEAVLRESRIRVGDLLALKAGHTLALFHPTDEPIECQVNGVVKYRGEMVNNGDAAGFRVVSEK